MTRPNRTAVVLLHALSQDASMWDEAARALRARGHPVFAPNQCGVGRSSTVDCLADDVAALLDEHGIGGAAIVGSSMGGYVALAFLRRYPDRVRALGLLATRATADDPTARAEREAFARRVVDPLAGREMINALAPKLVGAGTRARRPDILARVCATARSADVAALAWAQGAIAARRDSLDVLRTSTVPVVVIAGDEDELVSLAEAHVAATAAPRGRLVIVPGAGHLTPLETPDRITGALLDLLAEAGA